MRFLNFALAILLAFGVLVGLSAFAQANALALANAHVQASDLIGLPPALVTPIITLQSQIDAAPNGGTVNIAAGTYTESRIVKKNLTLPGVASGTNIIRPVALQRVIPVHNSP